KFPPEYLMFGYDEANMYLGQNLDENRRIAFQNSCKRHDSNAEQFDKGRKDLNLVKGDEVMLKRGTDITRRKLEPLFEGPYKVVQRISQTMYKLKLGNQRILAHVSKMKPLGQIDIWD